MPRYVGDTWTITANLVDASGQPADATSVSVTIRLPDGTSVGPFTMTHGVTGQYTYAYLAVQAGMHSATFAAVGAISPVGVVDFYAYPAAPGIVTLAETKTELRIAPTVTAYDDQLRGWIVASKTLLEQRTGPLVSRTVVDRFSGGKPSVTLTQPPVVAIVSVTETNYTLQPGDYALNGSSGILTRMFGSFPYRFLDGRDNIVVTYTAGVAGVWGENIRLANLELLRTWWLATQQQYSGGGAAEDAAYANMIYYLPPRVEKMLGTSDLPPGIA